MIPWNRWPNLLLHCCSAAVFPHPLDTLDTDIEAGLENITDAYTVLVPTNDAIAAALPQVNLTLDQVLNENATDTEALNIGLILAALLSYHILPEGAFTAKQLAGYTSLAPALSYPERVPAAGNVTITAPEAASGNVTFSGASNSTATVIVPDIKASPAQGKGQTFIAHIVDGVLLPPADVHVVYLPMSPHLQPTPPHLLAQATPLHLLAQATPPHLLQAMPLRRAKATPPPPEG